LTKGLIFINQSANISG